MRGLYAERQEALLEETVRSLSGLVEINRTDAGMNAIAWLPPGVDDVAAYRAALAEGVEAPPLSPFAQAPLERGALILNFAGYDPMAIHATAVRLAAALRRVVTSAGQRAG